MELLIKRVYDDPAPGDGFRVLVDRLWPRGLTKERADLDLWAKDVAPSAGLRTAFHHDGMTWDAFAAAYRAELAANPAVPALRAALEPHAVTTLLHSSREGDNSRGASREGDSRGASREGDSRGASREGDSRGAMHDPERNHAVLLREALLATS